MKLDHYTYRVTWSPEDGEHVGLLPRWLPICKRAVKQSQRLWQKSTTAASFASVFRPSCTASLR